VDPLFELALSVKALARELERWTNEAMRPLGVTGAQADAVAVIARTQPVSLKELGELLVAESGHPSRLVDRLVEQGLVTRAPSTDDGRRVELSLTRAGERVAARIDAHRDEMLASVRAVLTPAEVTAALRTASKLLALSPYAELVARRRTLV